MYGEVTVDFSPGINCPSECRFLKKAYSTDDIQYSNVKYTPAHHDGHLHKDIPTSDIIITNLHQDMNINLSKEPPMLMLIPQKSLC
mmetsp:Transcript_12147/g.17266  ORF Transcript_12147/g.17266 Transcript_12147/m.17266 type:complete len:86 (+) Transcript_12147:131-388(+)